MKFLALIEVDDKKDIKEAKFLVTFDKETVFDLCGNKGYATLLSQMTAEVPDNQKSANEIIKLWESEKVKP